MDSRTRSSGAFRRGIDAPDRLQAPLVLRLRL
jgi:hypothetical protein